MGIPLMKGFDAACVLGNMAHVSNYGH